MDQWDAYTSTTPSQADYYFDYYDYPQQSDMASADTTTNYNQISYATDSSPSPTSSSSSMCSSPAPQFNFDFYHQTVPENDATKKTDKGPKKKPLTEAVRRKRRLDANARERKRMTGLNEAFSRLRVVLGCNRDRPLSKMEALQMARQRIAELREMLEAPTQLQ